MANVKELINTFKEVFSDIKEIRWSDGDVSTASLATHQWQKQLPVLTDGLDFNQADPTINQSKVFGLSRAWAAAAEAGDVTLKLQIPSMAVLGWLWKESAATIKTASEEIDGKKGTFQGKGYALTTNKLTGTIMLISGDGQYALLIRHLEAYTSFAFSDAKSKPFAITLNTTLSGDVSLDNAADDFDIAYLKFTPDVPTT